ncbi:hypothetical protein GH740_09780 [Microbacterium sp. SYP-A9085]|nr:hypothetical protein [Microbacterium sp. SYP-A9085]
MMGESVAPLDARESAPLFYSEEETAALLGIHRTTLRTLALAGQAPVEPIRLTRHKRVYRRVDVERLAGLRQ